MSDEEKCHDFGMEKHPDHSEGCSCDEGCPRDRDCSCDAGCPHDEGCPRDRDCSCDAGCPHDEGCPRDRDCSCDTGCPHDEGCPRGGYPPCRVCSPCAPRNQSSLTRLFSDKDMLLIAGLIFLLMKQNADKKLILALAFVLLS